MAYEILNRCFWPRIDFRYRLAFSNDRKKVKYRPIITMVILQFILGFLLLNTSVGNILISGIADGFGELLKYAADGVNFVFGGLVNQKEFSFFLSVLMPIVFISAFNRYFATY